jgi:nucleoside-diphosphate-sugar epimerase
MRVVVTGGAGNLGSPVCRALAGAGLQVRAVDRVYRREVPVPLEIADLLDAQAVYRLLTGCDVVVHLANHPNPHGHLPPQRLYAENVVMDMNVFQAAADLGVRKLVFASSVQVFSGDRTTDDLDKPSCLAYLPIDGDMPTCPRNSYALSKETGEQQLKYFAALDPDLSCVALRFPALLTPWHMQWFGKMGPRAPRPYATHPDEGFGYLTVEDAGRLVLAVLQRLPPGYHQFLPAAPDNSYGLSTSEMIEKFYAGVPIRKPIENTASVIDTSAITEQVGWTSKSAAFPKEV